MRLSTIMGHSGLSGYAIVAMILFMAVFASLGIRMWIQHRRGELKGKSAMPLNDGLPVSQQGSDPAQDSQA